MSRHVGSYPLPPYLKTKLLAGGFSTVEDLEDLKPVELSKELKISPEEALEILRVVQGVQNDASSPSSSDEAVKTALDLLQEERHQGCIITFCSALDELLGGGVPLTKITEFCGAPGVGKTQMGMQLAIDVQIPCVFGGLGGEAVYVDTEGSFMVHRLEDMAKAAVEHCRHIATVENNREQLEAMSDFTVEHILSRIHFYRVHDWVELVALINILPEFLQQHPKIRLVVMDSIAFPFRHDFEDLSLRTRLLNGLAQNCIRLADSHKAAVVLVNQMTTKMGHSGDGQAHLVPALGESWGHASTIRVLLFWEAGYRYARLYKSPTREEATVPYQVTMAGIRDVCIPNSTQDVTSDMSQEEGTSHGDHSQRKRPRVS
ncbi:PREDICTED: DNA repair protein RAD51 homolog 3-like [Branchiostoma belcheri]|uniref:DNA repair protein RAD51 homolog 3 n=1 Tax=Branchiostoma belcheri TaxID=7741 RepID=A0A6P4XU31_BRABE|nr:PREDICTED: DNA repair protein RAD51 homolog 3-like [Branchiostoma belcheri]